MIVTLQITVDFDHDSRLNFSEKWEPVTTRDFTIVTESIGGNSPRRLDKTQP